MELVKEHPELRNDLPALQQALLGLAHNEAYRVSIYSRAIVPKTFALMDAWPEFIVLKRVLRGYTEPEAIVAETGRVSCLTPKRHRRYPPSRKRRPSVRDVGLFHSGTIHGFHLL